MARRERGMGATRHGLQKVRERPHQKGPRMTVTLDRANQRLLIDPLPPKADDFDTCQAYLKTLGVALVDIYSVDDLTRPAYWIVASASGHELSRGLTWVWAYAEYTQVAPW